MGKSLRLVHHPEEVRSCLGERWKKFLSRTVQSRPSGPTVSWDQHAADPRRLIVSRGASNIRESSGPRSQIS